MSETSPTAGPETGGNQGGKPGGSESLFTVILAMAANGLIAVAKTVAAFLTGSASMVAEAAHSWADTGNEVFLLIAERRGDKPADDEHPRGYGRETYIWSLFAAVGLFAAGSVVSIWHGITSLRAEETHENYLVNYIVLAIAFVLEGISFTQALRQTHGEAAAWGMRPLSFINRTSNPTLRAVFLEDFVALIGLVMAGAGVALHQVTGSPVYDALGSIGVGVLLGIAAIFLIERNRQFLVGQSVSPEAYDRTLRRLLENPDIERVTYLHMEYVGPELFFVVAAVDMTGDDRETDLAVRLRGLEHRLEGREYVADAVLTLSTPDEPSLFPAEDPLPHPDDEPIGRPPA